MSDNISLDQLRSDGSYDLVKNLYEDDRGTELESKDSHFQCGNIDCSYYDPAEFNKLTASFRDSTSFPHLINSRGLSANWASFRDLLRDLHSDQFSFDLIGISEVFRCDNDTHLVLPGYHDLIARCRDDGSMGGVGLFIKIRDDISVFTPPPPPCLRISSIC